MQTTLHGGFAYSIARVQLTEKSAHLHVLQQNNREYTQHTYYVHRAQYEKCRQSWQI